ncbi:arabinose efflux permease family protein [Frankia casuarinae]|jgi:MHS family alpha-ketoglutarate permease-like MFS transporter|uniref:Putative proline/betaine transporter n=3 Tax=Frankiaceae TaxID=74712 RepID=Q2J981_FRACC|nr:MFS transporter [Frankia sp. CeD]ABD12161.1 General substrate transporter [Frankia casuarinae]ETA02459.1 arabinose efflux permease family protein [Frankia sp. CcI6]KDA43118.1 arabinose efflux permease family protein [Frankia sp. BMG5.23]OHV48613.1 transporter [Frankia sp. CgIS1]ORT47745.1 MFS transporter [Frankia sp. KB5]
MTASMTATTGLRERTNHYRQLLAASVGNAVEWFDWYIYSMLAVYFSTQFFPASPGGSLVPLMSTLAIFAVGFFARPVGALILGILADRIGRRRTLSTTIMGMGLGSLIIGLAPTYKQVGVAAPALLLLARLIQGASAGGEYAAGSAFLIESAPAGRRGLYSSFFYISATSANLAAIGISALLASTLDSQNMTSWGWRIPFLLGSVAAMVGMWIRTHAKETLTQTADEPAGARRADMFEFLRRHPRESLQVFGLTAAPALVFYVWTAYLPTYANITVGSNLKHGLLSGVVALTIFLALQPVFGAISDRVGRRPMLLIFGTFFVVGTVPMLALLDGSTTRLLLVQIMGLVFLACWSCISSAVVAELFPARLRSSGIGFPYALSVALFGGTGPYVATYLVDIGHAASFGWYVTAVALVSTVVFSRLPETAHRPLH